MDFFQMYSGYVQAFPTALSVYDRHTRTNKEFRGFIGACMESPSCRGLDICAFLLTPIQRLPRYLLLLNELIKYTDSNHPDLYLASLAWDSIKACLVLLNESIHHLLHVASISTAWRCESRTKYKTRSGPSFVFCTGLELFYLTELCILYVPKSSEAPDKQFNLKLRSRIKWWQRVRGELSPFYISCEIQATRVAYQGAGGTNC